MAKWPAVILEDTWPCAIHHAINFQNASDQKTTTTSPYEAFTGQTPPWAIHDFRVFGSPTYVLQKDLQDSTFMALQIMACCIHWQLTCHASAIPLIYNPAINQTSPQFHILYDEYFHTVTNSPGFNLDRYLEKLFTPWPGGLPLMHMQITNIS
jgi:hypothetical protein